MSKQIAFLPTKEEQAIIVELVQSGAFRDSNDELHGLDRCDLRTGLRSILAGNDIIFFKVLANGDIRIVRVLGQKMDYKKVGAEVAKNNKCSKILVSKMKT